MVIVFICVLASVILSLPTVQTGFARYATKKINTQYGTNINIDKLKLSLITWDTAAQGIYVEDYRKDTLFYIQELRTSILSLRNLSNGILEFGDVDLDGVNFKLKTYKGEPDTNLDVFVAKLEGDQPRDSTAAPFSLTSSLVNIKKSRFQLIDENLEKSQILDFTQVAITGNNFTILGPEVSSDIRDLQLRSERGLHVDKMSTAFTYTLNQMRFDSLSIQTPGSHLKGQLHFNYDRSNFADFLNKVAVEASFEESTVLMDEINLLYDEFGKGKLVTFSSNVSGYLNNLNLEELFMTSDNSGIRGNFNFKNLFDKQQPFVMEANMRNVTTSYYELRALMPNILGNSLPSTFQKLGQFTARGIATISPSTIDAELNLNTAIGSSYADLEMADINNIDAATYTGFVSLIDFDLGNFIENDKVGKATLDFNVDGQGFVKENLNTEVIGKIYKLKFNNYEYQDINVSGVLKEQLFDGALTSNDENLKFTFKGLADFSEDRNNFNFIAAVDYADFKKLNFIRDSVSVFKGDVNMNITGTTLDNIVGDIKFSKTSYQNKNEVYYFEDFKVSSSFQNDTTRVIDINSPDIITGYMKGNFKVKELGKLLQNSVGSIYTNYRPFKISQGQRLSFNFKIYNKIVDVFYPEVAFGPNTFIRGNIIADEGDFKLLFRSPMIKAFGNEMDNINVRIDNKNPLYNTFVSVDDVSTSYYDVQDFSLINTTLKDTLFFRTEFKGGSEYNDSYNLNFYHTFNKENKSVIGLKTSDVSFKGNKWILNKEGNSQNKVILNKTLDSIKIEEIVMNNEEQEQIRLRGEIADSTYKDLQLQFKIVSLSKISPAIDSLNLQGEVNGILNIWQKDNLYRPTSNLEIKDFSINGIRMGHMNIGIAGNKDLTNFSVNTLITDKGKEKFSLIGSLTSINKTNTVNLLANFTDFDLEPFSPLGEDVISNIRGSVDGSARITGNPENPTIEGLLNLNNAGLGIPYLNVDYDFARNSRVSLYDQTFHFENIKVTDVDVQTKAVLDGTISHDFFRSWNLDLNVDTQNDRFLILNTEFDEDELYYGTGFLNGKGHIYGSTKALNIDVEGSTARGTSLKIPIRDVASVGDYSFINFIEKDEVSTIEAERTLEDYQGLELFFDLNVTRDAEVRIVVDQKNGSSLQGRGEGPLLIAINTNGKFEMIGEFVVVDGQYNFKYGGVIDKTFRVNPGGTILWDGSPLDAQLNMDAVYSLNANPAPLLDNDGYTKRIPTDVVVRLEGQLEHPEIGFSIDFPGASSMVKSELQYRLQDPTIEEKNAFFLLAQGTFVNEQTGINQQAVTGNLIQTASGLLNQVLGGNNDKFDFGLSYEQGYLNPNSDSQTEDKIGVNVSTQISDRVLLNGRLGVPVGGVSETVVAGDVEVQVLLNDEGTLSAKIFNRESQIQQFLADRQGYTQGVGLSYQVDFNTFRELMRKIFKGAQEEEPVAPILNNNNSATKEQEDNQSVKGNPPSM